MSDDELRRRLQDIPAPAARLDADAVVAGAKRRRRPKTIALTSAASVAGVLIVAPLVVPGLSLLPQGASQTVSSDAGAAPESAEQPEPGAPEPFESGGAESHSGPVQDSAGDGADDSAEDAGAGDTGAAGRGAPSLCGMTRAGDIGLTLRFLDDPGSAAPRVEAGGTGTGTGTGSGADAGIAVFVDLDALDVSSGEAQATRGSAEQDVPLGADAAPQVLGVTTQVLETDACGDGNPSAPSPVAIVALAAPGAPEAGASFAVVGEPWR